MRLAGIEVRDQDALELAMTLRSQGHTNTADRIETAAMEYEDDVALTIVDREAVLSVLIEADPSALMHTYGLVELRSVRLQERISRLEAGPRAEHSEGL